MSNPPPLPPWMPGDEQAADPRRHAPATLRNTQAILSVLRDVLPTRGTVLEIASGSGEHAVAFARAFPHLVFQPTDPDPLALASITAHAADARLGSVLAPLELDTAETNWPVARADAILCINMVHISSWAATLGLFDGASIMLAPGAPLYLYGPFLRTEIATAPSNLEFDMSLKERDPAWGLRDLGLVTREAASRGFKLDRVVEMPANNLSVVLRRA